MSLKLETEIKKITWISYIFLICFKIVDILTTYYGIYYTRIAIEANPLFSNVPLIVPTIWSLLIFISFFYLIKNIEKPRYFFCLTIFLIGCVLLNLFVIINNINVVILINLGY